MLASTDPRERCGTGRSDMVPSEIVTEAELESAEVPEPMTFAQTED